jgi:parallel beta-helix repeat protein
LTNNTITNFTHNFGIVGVKLWDFVQEIDSQNSVDSKPIYYWVHENGNNSSYSSDGGYYGFVNSTYMKVGNVSQIQYNLQAFLIAFSNHINLTNVTSSNTSYGVQSYMSNRNVIANSTFFHNHHAVYLGHSNYSTISNVSSRENYGIEPRTGVYLYKSYHNLITNNTTVSSNRPGIRLEYSYYNTVSYCNLTKNVVGGIAIIYGGDNNISRCDMTENEHGVFIMGSPSNNITNNTIVRNAKGIWIHGTFSQFNYVADNYILNSSDVGIWVKMASNNILSYNDISGSSSDGVHIDIGSSNAVIYNNITYNQGYGVKATNSGIMNQIHHNNFVCNKANCSDGYQGHDDSIPAGPLDGWHEPFTNIGNHWTNDSMDNNLGNTTDFPPTYWVDPSDPDPPLGLIKDQYPQAAPISNAGPRW